VDPAALFPNIGNLATIRIHPLGFNCLSKSVFVHARGTARHDDSIQTLIADGVTDDLLPRLRAHVDVIGAVGNTFNLSHLFSHRFDIDSPSDIDSTMADKNAELLHDRFTI
jgi:hypothetical protein